MQNVQNSCRFELGMLKLELAHKKLETSKDDEVSDQDDGENGGSEHGKYHGNSRIKRPKMTAFDERDDVDSYLHRFERYAELQGWKKTAWAIYLAALLKRKALDVYARLPTKQAQDYDKLKEALLKRYMMTEEGYKQKFHGSKPEVGESPLQFITRIASYFI